jgi:hypothetical protein
MERHRLYSSRHWHHIFNTCIPKLKVSKNNEGTAASQKYKRCTVDETSGANPLDVLASNGISCLVLALFHHSLRNSGDAAIRKRPLCTV